MLKKPLQFIFILLPLLILLVASTYFGYTNWKDYKIHSKLKIQLNNTKLLQSLEHSILNEVVCVATMGQHKNLMEKVCDPTKSTTDAVMHQILQQKADSSIYDLERVVLNTRNSIEDSGTIVVEKLVNGDLDKELNAFIQKYTNQLKEYSNGTEKKDYIRYFADISYISYATESEKALVSYYLSLKKPISEENLIYWDITASNSTILEVSDSSNISALHEDINKLLKDDNFQVTLRGIDDIRLDFMSNVSTGKYNTSVALWVSLINQKQKVLSNIENMLLGHIFDDVLKELNQHKMMTIWALVAFLLSLLGLLLFIKNWGKGDSHKDELKDLLHKISSLSYEYKNIEVNNNPNSYKMAYDYIGSSYEALYEKANIYELENKTNSTFLNNLTYDVKTPLNAISGYTKLLKETNLDTEQSEYISVIENNNDDLDSLLDKISSDNALPNKKLEMENSSFDLVKKIESAVETFSVKADQKDILLSLYIDPILAHKVRGDSVKFSKIMSNMIDNAIKSSKAYDTIDVYIEQLHKDDDQVSIKFSIKDQSVGYNENELNSIIEALGQIESVENLGNINVDIKNLSISSKIIKRMGGKLGVISQKGTGVEYYFTLSFENENTQSDVDLYPSFDGMKVGLALPSKDIKRQVDKNLEKYVKYLGAELIIYDYETIFDKNSEKKLPDLMFVYHHYARLEDELDMFSKLPTKIALLTSGTLRSRINIDKYTFCSIVFSPIAMSKIVKIFLESNVIKPILPDITSEDENSLENNLESTLESSFEHSLKNIHALVVEDNEISQKITINVLNKLGIKTSLASDGKEAFDLRRENDYSIILMDIEMPIMDGIEATSKILYYEGVNQFSHVPIIAMTADIDEHIKEKYIKVGMDDYISKPIESEVIFDLIQKYCIDLPKEIAQSEEDELIAKVLSGDFLKD